MTDTFQLCLPHEQGSCNVYDIKKFLLSIFYVPACKQCLDG